MTPLDEPGPRFDAERREDNAFWVWAAIEVLRRTGARIEELLELAHVSLRQYQAPTGELVPLLQISPSKTDTERVIPADPDLVAVLARIIRRVKADNDTVPLLQRHDTYERTFGPPLPHLFQRVTHHRLQVIPPDRIRQLLADLARRSNLTDVDGTPLRFTPHDIRRFLSTETVNGGLPIHIAAKVLGHLDLNTTMRYVNYQELQQMGDPEPF